MVRCVVVAVLLALPATALADHRGVIRFGVAPVDLAADADTPWFGGPVGDAVTAYNAAADAYNQAHGYPDGSPMATRAIGAGDLAVRTTMFTIAPAVEAGHPNAYVRVEALLGLADDLRSYGAGFYPLNLAARLHRTVTAYVSAGGTASWLDRPSTDDEIGVLLAGRAALGLRLGRHVTVEAGYANVLGGLFDRGRARSMQSYDPRGGEPPPSPSDAIAGGEQRGLVDVSMGVAF